jgi:hypothetical protein
MSRLDYRPHLPGPGESKIAGHDSESHAAARLAGGRAADLFAQWAKLAEQPFTGLTTDGAIREGLFSLKPEGAPAAAMAEAATALIGALTPAERARTCHEVGSPIWRRWQNTEIFVEEHGLRLEHASEEVRARAMAVVAASLSDRGYRDTVAVMRLNAFLGLVLNAPGVLNRWSYNFAVFGEPSTADPWGWQLWGHHLAVSCLTINGQMVLTPCFMGAEICHADHGPDEGVELFNDHELKGLALMNALPRDQRDAAHVARSLTGEDLPDGRIHFADRLMLGGAHQDNRVVAYEGALASTFSAADRNRLMDLAEAYVGVMPNGPRAAKMEAFERHLADTHFCWIGGHGPDDPFYYRIQSPVLFIEFDHHPGLLLTNAEPSKMHVHTVVRTPNGNDYGIDLLRQHYQGGHHHHHDH